MRSARAPAGALARPHEGVGRRPALLAYAAVVGALSVRVTVRADVLQNRHERRGIRAGDRELARVLQSTAPVGAVAAGQPRVGTRVEEVLHKLRVARSQGLQGASVCARESGAGVRFGRAPDVARVTQPHTSASGQRARHTTREAATPRSTLRYAHTGDFDATDGGVQARRRTA